MKRVRNKSDRISTIPSRLSRLDASAEARLIVRLLYERSCRSPEANVAACDIDELSARLSVSPDVVSRALDELSALGLIKAVGTNRGKLLYRLYL